MRKSKILLRAGLIGLVSVSLGILSTKLDVVTAQISNQFSNFSYTGIENRAETVYNINFSGNDDSSVNNTMEINEDNMFLMSTIPVIVNEAGMTRNSLDDSNDSNILGGDNITVQTSHNVTIIGGDGRDVEYDVGGENSNATFFGGKGNHLDGNSDPNEAPTVLLGGESNIVESNQGSIVIVGGNGNNVKEPSKNVNILGGQDVKIGGENIIVGGSDMNIIGVNDMFIFSDGEDSDYAPQTSGAFFLNVSNGVGFGTGVEGNLGAISNGAVSIGVINAAETQCNNANVGLQGVLDGCLVGCTQASAQLDSHPWELLDHGTKCEEICDGNEQCIQTGSQNIIEDYTSFCTKGLVYTGNSHLCPRSSKIYKNVIFETYLIDSDDNCPSPASTYNQCAYQCNLGSHLTGDVTGKKDGVTMCFEDCKLPWNSNITKKHNETIIAYNSGAAYCTGTAGDTCAAHKANLICVDGDRYTTNSEGKAELKDTTHIYGTCTLKIPGCEGYDLTKQQIIEERWDVLQDRQDLFTTFLQWISDIFSLDWQPDRNRPNYGDFGFNDDLCRSFVRGWYYCQSESLRDLTKQGIRGKYSLCIGYGPGECDSSEAPCNESCKEPKPTTYHYRFDGCREGYVLDGKVCRKNCRFISRFGTETRMNHGSGFTLYGASATCPNNCTAQEYICYDGRLYKAGTLNVTETRIDGEEVSINGVVGQSTCTLNGVSCNGYAISELIRSAHSGTSIYDSCQKYTTTSNPSQCITGDVVYTLTGCANNYHTENVSPINNQYCVSNTKPANCIAGTKPDTASWSGNSLVTATWSGSWNNGSWQIPSCEWQCNAGYYKNWSTCTQCPTGYTSNTGATAQNQCYITCTAGNHLAVANDSSCTACPVGKTTTQHNVHYGNTSSCSDCTSWKPEHSSYYNGCDRQCDAGYYKEAYQTYNNQGGWRCTLCPDDSTSNTGAESLSECYAKPQCGTKSTIYYTDANTYCATGSSPVTSPGVGVVEIPNRSQATYGGSSEIIGYRWTCRNSHGDEKECSGRLPDSCTGPCGTVNHGETLTCYNLNSVQCPGTCVNESHLCIDGQFGNYVYQMDIGRFGFMPINFEHDYIHSTCTLRGTNNSSYYDEDTAWNMTLQSGYLFNAITGYIVVDNHCEAETFYQWNGHCFNEDYIWDSYEGHPGYVLTGTECNMLLVDGVWRRNCQFVSHKINGECVPQENRERYKWDYPHCLNGYTVASAVHECVLTPACDFSKSYPACSVGYVHHNPGQGSSSYNQYWNCINPNWHNAATASANVAMTPCTR